MTSRKIPVQVDQLAKQFAEMLSVRYANKVVNIGPLEQVVEIEGYDQWEGFSYRFRSELDDHKSLKYHTFDLFESDGKKEMYIGRFSVFPAHGDIIMSAKDLQYAAYILSAARVYQKVARAVLMDGVEALQGFFL